MQAAIPVSIVRSHRDNYATSSEDFGLQESMTHCRRILAKLDDDVTCLTQNANESIFSGIESFVLKQASIPSIARYGIPACLILTGVNLQDHNFTLCELERRIRVKCSSTLAILEPAKCRTLELCTRALFQQFSSTQLKQRSGSAASCSMAMLKSWYTESGLNQPLVVLIRDVEAFAPQVLADVVSVCNSNIYGADQKGLPFIFLLTISTSQHALQRILPNAVVNKLQVFHRFTLPPAVDLMPKLLERFLLQSQSLFMLGKEVLDSILAHFFSHGCSLLTLVNVLKYSVVQHFHESPILCHLCLLDLTIEESAILVGDVHNSKVFSYLAQLPSIKSELKHADEGTIRRKLPAWVSGLQLHQRAMICALQCLEAALSSVRAGGAASRSHEILLCSLDGFQGECHAVVDEACQALRSAPVSALPSTLEAFHAALQTFHTAATAAARSSAAPCWANDAARSAKEALLRTEQLLAPNADHREPLRAAPAHAFSSSMSARRRGMVSSWAAESELGREAAVLLQSITGLVHPWESRPLWEAVTLRDAASLVPALSACPRDALHTALVQPAEYLCAEGGAEVGDEALEEVPDACRLYRLALAEGPRFSGPEWFRAFRLSVMRKKGGARRMGKSEAGGISEAAVEARFRESVASLELIGLIGPAARDGCGMAHLVFPPPPATNNKGVRLAVDEEGCGDGWEENPARRGGKRRRDVTGGYHSVGSGSRRRGATRATA